MEAGKDRHRCRGRRGRLRRRRSTQSSPRRQWRRREAAEEKGGSELRVSATTRLMEDWEAATEEAFAREGGTSGGRWRLPGHGGSRERRRSRRRQPTMLGVDAGETEEKRPSGNRERRRRWLGLCVIEKETVEKEEAEVDGCDGELGRRGGLMKTETRPTATEKSEGLEDPHVVGDGKEEGERELAVETKFAEDTATASRRRKEVGFAVAAVKEEKAVTVEEEGGEGEETGGSPVEERERREEKPGLTASRGRSRGRRQRSASKNGDAGARRDSGGREKFFFFFLSSGTRYQMYSPNQHQYSF